MPFFERCQARFCLNTLIIIKVNVFVNELPRLVEGSELMSVNALCFENGEEILSHSIVIAVSLTAHAAYHIMFS